MRLPFQLRSFVVVLLCWGSTLAAHASHLLCAELTYEYAGTAALPNQYRVMARIFSDGDTAPPPLQITVYCAKNGCSTPGSFNATLGHTGYTTLATGCTNTNGPYIITLVEGLVQLPPARWALSIDLAARIGGLVNLPQFPATFLSTLVVAELDNTTGLVNSSPRFTTSRLVRLVSTQPQHYSLNAFDSEGDSLAYELVQPRITASSNIPCGVGMPAPGTLAPHFQVNAITGELLTVAGVAQQGSYALAGRVNEYRRINGAWQQIGSIMADRTYFFTAGANQVPTFTSVARTGSPTIQLLNQTIRVVAGQTLSLTLAATDADAGQLVTLNSNVAGIVPGATFQPLANGQGQLTWQVPATLPPGRYAFTATAFDDACPVPGHGVLTLSFLVTPQVLAAQPSRQPLAQLPFPIPFQEEVRFRLTGPGRQPVVITDELGRTVAQLLSAADGSIVWRPAAAVSAGLYLARNLAGTQVARLSYTGH